jgi:hypothetical protein
MLDAFQKEVLRIIAANRTPDSFIARGSALNRLNTRQSRDLDIFHRTLLMIDLALERDLQTLKSAGLNTDRFRETSTMREWIVSDATRATRVQWTRDTSWLFMPAVPDPDFGFALTFEDLAVNKMSAAADRGRIRDYHDLLALDFLGAPPWVLALGVMGKDAELSPPMALERALRLLPQAGEDDEDPDYEGPSIPWRVVRERMEERLRSDLNLFGNWQWIEWAGVLPIDKSTGRLALNLFPDTIAGQAKARATITGSWPTSPGLATDMLCHSVHPLLAGVTLDASKLIASR